MTGARPLTEPEQLLLASNRAEVPIIIALLGRTDGHVDAHQLAKATVGVFARHRATRSELRDLSGAGGWRIMATSRPAPMAELDVATPDDAWHALRAEMLTGIDLTRAPLVRMLVFHHPDGDWLGIVGHHLAIDGRGLFDVLTETMAAYQPPAGSPAPAGARVGANARVSAPWPWPVVDARRAAGARVLRLVTPASRYLAPAGPPGVAGFTLSREVIPVPRPRRRPYGPTPTVNDVLVAAVHLAAGRWNALHGRPSGTLRVRVALGAPTRTELDGLSAGFVLVASDQALRAAPARLLAAVAERTAAAKSRMAAERATPAGTGTAGAAGGAADTARGLARLALSATPARLRTAALRLAVAIVRPALMPTAAVSNLGHVPTDLTVGAGGPRLLDLHLTAPGRMPQGLAVHVVRMADRVHLSFCHARELMDADSAREFVGLYLAAVTELAESATVPSQPVEGAAGRLLRTGTANVSG